MSAYERTLSIEAPADAVFGYVSDPTNVPQFLPEAEGAQFNTDPEGRELLWTGEKSSGSILVETGDVTPELCEITMRLEILDRQPADTSQPADEQTLERMDQALAAIRKHVEHAHRTHGANFL